MNVIDQIKVSELIEAPDTENERVLVQYIKESKLTLLIKERLEDELFDLKGIIEETIHKISTIGKNL